MLRNCRIRKTIGLCLIWLIPSFVSSTTTTRTIIATASYSVRNLAANENTNNLEDAVFSHQQQTSRKEQPITYSEEGVPYTIPQLTIRLFQTPGSLNVDSLRAVQVAMEQFLLDGLATEFASSDDSATDGDGENDGDTTDEVVTDVTITILDDRSVTERYLRNLSSSSPQQHRRLRQGSEIEMEAVLDFAGQPIPSDKDISEAVGNVLSDMSPFINDYLLKTNELMAVDTAIYDVTSFSAPPTSTPSAPPSGIDNGLDISQINRGEPVNVKPDKPLKALYPAVIVGVGAMILTMLFLAHRRRKVSDIEDDDDENSSIERAKAAPVEIDTEDGGWVEHMPDGQTTIHIPHMADASGTYDPYRANAREPSSASGFVLSSASSMGSSFDEREYYDVMGDLLPSIHYGDGKGYESEESSELSVSQGGVYPPMRGAVKRVDMAGTVT